jgi:hypothetical protein
MRVLPAFLLAALLTAPLAARAETPVSDPKAVAIADQVMDALGGKKRWDDLRGIRWTFGNEVNDTVKSSRRHSWDKHTGWHRVSGKNRAGQAFVAIENLNDGKGMAWVEGNRIEGDSLAKMITFAKRTWTNDSYWFLMPYKLRDPGVTLRYEGQAKVDGRPYDKIALSFDQVGETPGDHYWVYVNPETHRVERWDMVLQSDKPPPKSYTWEGWQAHDGLWFPTAHRNTEHLNIFTRDVQTMSEFPPGEFTSP